MQKFMEICSAGRSRPPARPARSISMSPARWPVYFRRTGDPRRRHRIDGRQRDAGRGAGICLSHGAQPAAANMLHIRLRRFSRRSIRCIRRSNCRIPASPILSKPEKRSSSPTNACAHLFVLGAPSTADWRAVDLVEHRPVVTLRGQRFVGYGGNVLGDPRVALTWLANELRAVGRDAKGRRGGDDRHMPRAAADPVRRPLRSRFRGLRQGFRGARLSECGLPRRAINDHLVAVIFPAPLKGKAGFFQNAARCRIVDGDHADQRRQLRVATGRGSRVPSRSRSPVPVPKVRA